MRMDLSVLVVTLVFWAAWGGAPVAAQEPQVEIVVADSGVVQEIRLVDGTVYHGRVVEAGDPVRFMLTTGDVLEIRRDRIRSLQVVEARVVEGRVWPVDPNETRLFFGPTGRSLERGQGYLAMYEILMPFLALAPHDRITLAGGFPLFFGEGTFLEVFWIAPKIQVVRTDFFKASVGALSFFSTSESESIGIVYGVGTFGETSDQSVTVGIGYGYASSEFADQPVLMAGAEGRLSRGTKLLTENWIFPQEGVILSAGPRFFGERLTADLGLALPIFKEQDGFFVFPLVNFVYNW